MAEEIRVGDVGTALDVTIKNSATGQAENISAATVKQIKLLKPNGQALTKPAVFVTGGVDGKLRYVTVDGDLNLAGTWKIQGFVTLPDGSWHTTIGTFEVHKNLS